MANNPLFSERKVGDKFLRSSVLETYLSAPTLQKSAAMEKKALPLFLLTAPLLAAQLGLGAWGLSKDVPSAYRNIKAGKKKEAMKDIGLSAIDAIGMAPGAGMLAQSLRGGTAAAKAVRGAKNLKDAINVGEKAYAESSAEALANRAAWIGNASEAKPGLGNMFSRNRMAQRDLTQAAAIRESAKNIGVPRPAPQNMWQDITEAGSLPFRAIGDVWGRGQYAPMFYLRNLAPEAQMKLLNAMERLSKTKPWMATEMGNKLLWPAMAGAIADPYLRESKEKPHPSTMQAVQNTAQLGTMASGLSAPLSV